MDQPDCPRSCSCFFSSFFSKENKSKEWSLCLPAQECAGNCARVGLGNVSGPSWGVPGARLGNAGVVLGSGWDWAGKFTGMNWEAHLASQDSAGECTSTRLGSLLGSGWEEHQDWAGKCLVWGGSVLEFGWELYLDQAGKRAGLGLGSSLGLSWEGFWEWVEECTGTSLGWEAPWEWAGSVAIPVSPLQSSKKPKTAEADTSSELAKKSKEVFRKEVRDLGMGLGLRLGWDGGSRELIQCCLPQMSQFIVQCLNPYRKPDCKVGRITTTEDFKHLARKVGMWEYGNVGMWGAGTQGWPQEMGLCHSNCLQLLGG